MPPEHYESGRFILVSDFAFTRPCVFAYLLLKHSLPGADIA